MAILHTLGQFYIFCDTIPSINFIFKEQILAIKENLDYIKDKLNTEEQFLENAIRGERFIKKYKFYIIGFLALAIVLVSANYTVSYLSEQKAQKANLAYNELLQNPNNESAKSELKNLNPSLFGLFVLQTNASKELIDEALALDVDPLLKDILQDQPNSQILSNYKSLGAGYKALKENNLNLAKIEFLKIKNSPNLISIANSLEHYQGK